MFSGVSTATAVAAATQRLSYHSQDNKGNNASTQHSSGERITCSGDDAVDASPQPSHMSLEFSVNRDSSAQVINALPNIPKLVPQPSIIKG